MTPPITLITPSFNQAAFLEQTIQSVLDQRYPNLQYGIVDGGSTDGSADIIHRYRRHLDFAIIEPDHGQSEAMNKGLRRARHDIVGWLCSDDMLTPNALSIVGDHFAQHPSDTWIAGVSLAVDPDGQVMSRLVPAPCSVLADALLRSQARPFHLPQPSVFWRRSLHDDLGYLDESLHYCMDFDLWCRFLRAGHHPTILEAELSLYRMHEVSKTCAQPLNFVREHLIIEKRYARDLPLSKRPALYRWLGYRRRQYYCGLGRRALVGQVLRRPWWLASQQVRQTLVQPRSPQATPAASLSEAVQKVA